MKKRILFFDINGDNKHCHADSNDLGTHEHECYDEAYSSDDAHRNTYDKLGDGHEHAFYAYGIRVVLKVIY